MAAVFAFFAALVWVLWRVLAFAAWALARTVLFLARRPRAAAAAVAAAGVTWLAWPLLTSGSGSAAAVWIVGVLGGAAGVTAVARAVLDDHRYEKTVQAREAAEAAAEAEAVPARAWGEGA